MTSIPFQTVSLAFSPGIPVFPAQVILKLKPAMTAPSPAVNLWGLALPVLELLGELYHALGMSRVQTLVSIDVPALIPLSSPSVAGEWIKTQSPSYGQKLIDLASAAGVSYAESLYGMKSSSDEDAQLARQLLLLTFSDSTKLPEVLRTIQGWKGLEYVYTEIRKPIRPDLESIVADPPIVFGNASVDPKQTPKNPTPPASASFPPNDWFRTCIGWNNQWAKDGGPVKDDIAVLDIGVDKDHPYLSGKVDVLVQDASGKARKPVGAHYHGTAICGLICGSKPSGLDITSNATSMPPWKGGVAFPANGLLPKSRVQFVEVFDFDSGGYSVSISAVATYAAALVNARLARSSSTLMERLQQIRVLNLSWGADDWDRTLYEALASLTARGIVVVVSGGNRPSIIPNESFKETPNNLMYPAAYPNALAVGALQQVIQNKTSSCAVSDVTRNGAPNPTARLYDDKKNAIDTPSRSAVDVFAPGQSIWLCTVSKSNDKNAIVFAGRASGTSFAAPLVTAAISYALANNKGRSSKDVVDKLRTAWGTAKKLLWTY